MNIFKYFLFSLLVLAAPSVFAMNENSSREETQQETCAICLELMSNKPRTNRYTTLPCKINSVDQTAKKDHSYHKTCIINALQDSVDSKKDTKCPLCRTLVSKDFCLKSLGLNYQDNDSDEEHERQIQQNHRNMMENAFCIAVVGISIIIAATAGIYCTMPKK